MFQKKILAISGKAVGSGSRKRGFAVAIVRPGTGKVKINNERLGNFHCLIILVCFYSCLFFFFFSGLFLIHTESRGSFASFGCDGDSRENGCFM